MPQKPSEIDVDEGIFHMNLAFKCDVTSELMVCKLSKVAGSTFPAAKLGLIFSTLLILKFQLIDQLPSWTTFNSAIQLLLWSQLCRLYNQVVIYTDQRTPFDMVR